MRRTIAFSVVLIVCLAQAAADEATSRFVHTQVGELPIILSAPHGGTWPIPDVNERQGIGLDKSGRGFVVARDSGTQELAEQVAQSIETRFGKKPFFVIARSHRKYLDPNRPPPIAYEDPQAKPIYDHYHAALSEACRAVQAKFHRGLLLDLHGQGTAKDTVFRGTQNGKSMTLLRERFGETAHTGETSLFGRLKSRGWNVHPNPLANDEQAGFRGGFIVQTYGSHQPAGIDAVQLEFGSDFRSAENRAKTAVTLTEAITEYSASYLGIAVSNPSNPNSTDSDVRIRVAVFQGAGTGASRAKLVTALTGQPHLQVRDMTVDDIVGGELQEVQVLVHPGGSGSGQGQALGEVGRRKVREFVQSGGGFVGVCAGAYLATCDYEWSLHLLDAKVVDRKHWNRGFGTVEIGLSPRGREFFELQAARLPIYYHQGPLLAPAENPNIPDYENLATFETEIVNNGAAPGVMRGCTAIASGPFHQGRVFCFSPHPELTDGRQSLLLRAIAWSAQTGPIR